MGWSVYKNDDKCGESLGSFNTRDEALDFCKDRIRQIYSDTVDNYGAHSVQIMCFNVETIKYTFVGNAANHYYDFVIK